MTVFCPDCRSVFRVDPAKVPATGVRARCSVCGGVIAIAGGTLPVSVTPASSGIVLQTFASATPGGLEGTGSGVTVSGVAGGVSSSATVMTPPAPLSSHVPPLRTPIAVSIKPMATPAVSPAGMNRSGVSGSAGRLTPSAAKKPINPFLNADPGQRARRLARALVSDLVAYHPQKREEGLRDGTLRQLFREEIKKSYEEFVEQVGRDLAEGSPHFQEALNEILGGGRKLF